MGCLNLPPDCRRNLGNQLCYVEVPLILSTDGGEIMDGEPPSATDGKKVSSMRSGRLSLRTTSAQLDELLTMPLVSKSEPLVVALQQFAWVAREYDPVLAVPNGVLLFCRLQMAWVMAFVVHAAGVLGGVKWFVSWLVAAPDSDWAHVKWNDPLHLEPWMPIGSEFAVKSSC
ncbi:hypothetical protein Nepgr_033556 [Nepenthes gracilis]|uniref:Uncharacterized protein n=1 Tax=Nepenthes gracilis TaxID=150966 RepID=A0AAD3TMS9_NEPGR|nr:hypothetical protein Nepgr_033556 [Nepenthes gracilis]